MKTIEESAIITALLQKGGELMAKALGVPAADYQRVVMSGEWKAALKAARMEAQKKGKVKK